MELLDKIYIGELVLTYGEMLTKKQLSAVKSYYLLDIGLSEIAEVENISRQGAYDLVNKSRAILLEFEEKLGVVKLKRELLNGLSEMEKSKVSAIKQKIKELKLLLE